MKGFAPLPLLLAVMSAVLLSACNFDSGSPPRDRTSLEAELSSRNTVPPVTPDQQATGTGEFSVDEVTGAFNGEVTVEGLTGTATAARIHTGFAGLTGEAFLTLTPGDDSGEWVVPPGTDLSNAEVQQLLDGELYVNVTTTLHPTGEVRGQILPDDIAVATARLSGEFEVPEVDSSGWGAGFITVDEGTGEAMLALVAGNLTGTATDIHLHQAPAGVNGPKLFILEQDATGSNVWSLDANFTDGQIETLRDGGLYFNVHTSAYTDGEIRGQALTPDVRVVRTVLAGQHEVPPVDSDAGAVGYTTIDEENQSVNIKVHVHNLSDATAAHLHDGFAGDNGGHVIPLTNTETGFFETESLTLLSNDEFDTLLAGGHYLNVHSTGHADGEIRGQVAPFPITVVRTVLSVDNEVPPVDTTGQGIGYSTVHSLNGDIVVHVRTENLSSTATGAHVHRAPAGSNGPIVIGLEQPAGSLNHWRTPDGSRLDAADLLAFWTDTLYLNVHTVDHTAGEVRGQIDPDG